MIQILDTLVKFEDAHKSNIGYFYSIFGNICMSVMQVCAKQLSHYLATSQFLMYRAFCLAAINTTIIMLSGHSVYVKKQRVWKILCLRMFISSMAVYLQFLPLKYLPLSILNSIRMTAPIFTHFIEACIMGTKINKKDLLITCLSFIGIIFMVKPEFLFEKNIKLDVPSFYAALALMGTLMLSIQSILVRLVKDDITNDVLVEYFYLSQIYINGLTFLVFDANSSQTRPWVNSCIILFVVIVITGYAGQILNTRSLFMISASKAMPFRYINVIIGFFIDVFYYSLSFDWLSILGIMITSLSLAYMTLQKISKH